MGENKDNVLEAKKKKEVIKLESFGICPRCGKLMFMLHSQYTLYGMTETGKYPNKIVNRDEDYTIACLCGFKCPMVNTLEGTIPRDYYKLKNKELERKINSSLIGYIDD